MVIWCVDLTDLTVSRGAFLRGYHNSYLPFWKLFVVKGEWPELLVSHDLQSISLFYVINGHGLPLRNILGTILNYLNGPLATLMLTVAQMHSQVRNTHCHNPFANPNASLWDSLSYDAYLKMASRALNPFPEIRA